MPWRLWMGIVSDIEVLSFSAFLCSLFPSRLADPALLSTLVANGVHAREGHVGRPPLQPDEGDGDAVGGPRRDGAPAKSHGPALPRYGFLSFLSSCLLPSGSPEVIFLIGSPMHGFRGPRAVEPHGRPCHRGLFSLGLSGALFRACFLIAAPGERILVGQNCVQRWVLDKPWAGWAPRDSRSGATQCRLLGFP